MSALALGVLGAPSIARAQGDSFGIGDGHSGPKNVTATGEVNSYAGVAQDIAAGATSITITTSVIGPAFAEKDLILVWRATGVAASEAPSGDQNKRLDLSSALATTSSATLSAGAVGRYEFARVKSVSGPVLTLEQPMLNGFTKNVTQVVRVPEFTTVNINAGVELRAAPWQELGSTDASNPNPNNPWVGGILIFFANGAITNSGTIHANARGFHGAVPAAHTLNRTGLVCNPNNLDGDPSATQNQFSPKGEGVVQSKYTAQSGGKGNISMAGGGGDCFESGGGGGANVGNGGAGSATLLTANSGGFGGVGIDYDVFSRLTMGGGGGGGRHVVGLNSEVSFGGFGGGVVYIRAQSLGGTGKLQANGGNGEDSGVAGLPKGVASEGSGGGGAGGTIVVRLTGTLDCSQLASAGGNGGNAEVLGSGVLGAGGGGGGGRILFQAQTKTGACVVNVDPGQPGNGGTGGAQSGTAGSTGTPGLPPLCVPASPGVPGSCPVPTPVCDATTGQCTKCSGPFGSGPPDPCEVATKPVCNGTDGTCHPCDGDFGSTAANKCQLANAPTCFATGDPSVAGSCGKCTKDADCAGGTHSGPICDLSSGSCGKGCTKDTDCQSTEWCAPSSATSTTGVCVPKVPNSQPVPAGPPINGECTPANGQRTCLSAVCEESDDLCGKKNSSPCPGGSEQCRSNICFPPDRLCGLPNGEPCAGNGQCRSELCKDGKCVGKPCGSDTDCPAPGQVCDPNTNTCVDGCRPGLSSPSDGGVVNGVCPPPATCVSDGGPIGTCVVPNDNDAGDAGGSSGGDAGSNTNFGIIEGGGCSCSSTITSASSPLALLGAISSVLLMFRRRGTRKSRGE
jgi:hypothetical protein